MLNAAPNARARGALSSRTKRAASQMPSIPNAMKAGYKGNRRLCGIGVAIASRSNPASTPADELCTTRAASADVRAARIIVDTMGTTTSGWASCNTPSHGPYTTCNIGGSWVSRSHAGPTSRTNVAVAITTPLSELPIEIPSGSSNSNGVAKIRVPRNALHATEAPAPRPRTSEAHESLESRCRDERDPTEGSRSPTASQDGRLLLALSGSISIEASPFHPAPPATCYSQSESQGGQDGALPAEAGQRKHLIRVHVE